MAKTAIIVGLKQVLSLFADFTRAILFLVLTRWFYCTNSQIANKHIESKGMVFCVCFSSMSLFLSICFAMAEQYGYSRTRKWLCNRGLYFCCCRTNKLSMLFIYFFIGLFSMFPSQALLFMKKESFTVCLCVLVVPILIVLRFYDYWIASQHNDLCNARNSSTFKSMFSPKIKAQDYSIIFCSSFVVTRVQRATNLIEAYETDRTFAIFC